MVSRNEKQSFPRRAERPVCMVRDIRSEIYFDVIKKGGPIGCNEPICKSGTTADEGSCLSHVNKRRGMLCCASALCVRTCVCACVCACACACGGMLC